MKNNKNSNSTNIEEEGRQEGEEHMQKGERFQTSGFYSGPFIETDRRGKRKPNIFLGSGRICFLSCHYFYYILPNNIS